MHKDLNQEKRKDNMINRDFLQNKINAFEKSKWSHLKPRFYYEPLIIIDEDNYMFKFYTESYPFPEFVVINITNFKWFSIKKEYELKEGLSIENDDDYFKLTENDYISKISVLKYSEYHKIYFDFIEYIISVQLMGSYFVDTNEPENKGVSLIPTKFDADDLIGLGRKKFPIINISDYGGGHLIEKDYDVIKEVLKTIANGKS